jgi:hypothetical protein
VGSDCVDACSCNNLKPFYLSTPCDGDDCVLSNATGIFNDERCLEPAADGFYSDGSSCYEWDGTSVLTSQGPC